MTTSASVSASCGARFYTKDGQPVRSMTGRNGKERAPTIRDARQHGYVPSVTTVLKVLHSEGLAMWLQEQAVLAVLTTPIKPGEAQDDYVHRVLHVERQQDQESQKARDRGTDMHAAMATLFNDGKIDEELEPWVLPAYNEAKHFGSVMFTEKCVVGKGYAGTCDLGQLLAGTIILSDYKCVKRIPTEPYPEQKMQLAAYRAALARTTDATIYVRNIYISTTEMGRFSIIDHDDVDEAYEYGFLPCLRLYRWLKGLK